MTNPTNPTATPATAAELIKELEAEIQRIQDESAPQFKVGDKAYMLVEITNIDPRDKELPYEVSSDERSATMWVSPKCTLFPASDVISREEHDKEEALLLQSLADKQEEIDRLQDKLAEHERLLEEEKQLCPSCWEYANKLPTPADNEFLQELDKAINRVCGAAQRFGGTGLTDEKEARDTYKTALRDFVLANRGHGGGDIDRSGDADMVPAVKPVHKVHFGLDAPSPVAEPVVYKMVSMCEGSPITIYEENKADAEYMLKNNGGTMTPLFDHPSSAVPAVEPVGWFNLYDDRNEQYKYKTERDARTVASLEASEVAVPLFRHPSPVAVPAVEPVGYANFCGESAKRVYKTPQEALLNTHHLVTEKAVPLYRHPSHVAGAAVGSKGVKANLRRAFEHGGDSKLVKEWIDSIIELPEPSDVAKRTADSLDRVATLNGAPPMSASDRKDLAAALLAEVKP